MEKRYFHKIFIACLSVLVFCPILHAMSDETWRAWYDRTHGQGTFTDELPTPGLRNAELINAVQTAISSAPENVATLLRRLTGTVVVTPRATAHFSIISSNLQNDHYSQAAASTGINAVAAALENLNTSIRSRVTFLTETAQRARTMVSPATGQDQLEALRVSARAIAATFNAEVPAALNVLADTLSDGFLRVYHTDPRAATFAALPAVRNLMTQTTALRELCPSIVRLVALAAAMERFCGYADYLTAMHTQQTTVELSLETLKNTAKIAQGIVTSAAKILVDGQRLVADASLVMVMMKQQNTEIAKEPYYHTAIEDPTQSTSWHRVVEGDSEDFTDEAIHVITQPLDDLVAQKNPSLTHATFVESFMRVAFELAQTIRSDFLKRKMLLDPEKRTPFVTALTWRIQKDTTALTYKCKGAAKGDTATTTDVSTLAAPFTDIVMDAVISAIMVADASIVEVLHEVLLTRLLGDAVSHIVTPRRLSRLVWYIPLIGSWLGTPQHMPALKIVRDASGVFHIEEV